MMKNLKNILRIISESALRAPIWRGRVLLLTSIGIVLLFPPQVVHAVSLRKDQRGDAHITICNSGNTTLNVARVTNAGFWGYTNKAYWVAEGWRQVEPDECESFERSIGGSWGDNYLPGYYYFAFIITGKNGQGTIKSKLDPGPSDFENTNQKFCVDITQGFARQVKDSSLLDDCPSGWVLVPFSIGISVPWSGGKYKLTINADRSSEVELLTPPKP